MTESQLETNRRLLNPENDLDHLRAIHHSIIRLAAVGTPERHIASVLDVSPSMVRNTLRSNLAQSRIADLQRQMNEELVRGQARLSRMVDTGLSFFEDVLDGEIEVSAALKTRIVESVLDRAGLGKTAKVETRNINAHVTAADLERWRSQDGARKIYDDEIDVTQPPVDPSLFDLNEEKNVG